MRDGTLHHIAACSLRSWKLDFPRRVLTLACHWSIEISPALFHRDLLSDHGIHRTGPPPFTGLANDSPFPRGIAAQTLQVLRGKRLLEFLSSHKGGAGAGRGRGTAGLVRHGMQSNAGVRIVIGCLPPLRSALGRSLILGDIYAISLKSQLGRLVTETEERTVLFASGRVYGLGSRRMETPLTIHLEMEEPCHG